jgi:hypothetical protein
MKLGDDHAWLDKVLESGDGVIRTAKENLAEGSP